MAVFTLKPARPRFGDEIMKSGQDILTFLAQVNLSWSVDSASAGSGYMGRMLPGRNRKTATSTSW